MDIEHFLLCIVHVHCTFTFNQAQRDPAHCDMNANKIYRASIMLDFVAHPYFVAMIMHVSMREIWVCWACYAEGMLGIQKALPQLTHHHTNTACSQREEMGSHPPQTSTQSRNMTFDFSSRLSCHFYFTQRNPQLWHDKTELPRTIIN